MEYPKIIRDTIDFTSDTEVCNIGYKEIVLDDGRPVRIEEWSSHGIDTATVFFSKLDLENKSEDEIKRYLIDNNIIKVNKDNIYITELEDSEDNIFISVNIPLIDHDDIINELLIILDEYDY